MIAMLFMLGGADHGYGCTSANTSEARKVNEQQHIYVTNQPAPVFDWSLERHLMIQLYQARNRAVATYSYVQSPYTGKVLFSCPSIGFPIPANTQLTNPESDILDRYPLPQAEPNGLYSSPSTHGTYIMCVNKAGKVTPAYSEPNVVAFVMPMREVNGTLVPVGGSEASISIDPGRR